MLRRTVLKGIAATTASGLLAHTAAAETPLKIGISMPLTGAGFNAVGRQLQAALKFAPPGILVGDFAPNPIRGLGSRQRRAKLKGALHVNGRAVRSRDDDVLDISDRLDEADAAHDRPLSGLLNDVPADVVV